MRSSTRWRDAAARAGCWTTFAAAAALTLLAACGNASAADPQPVTLRWVAVTTARPGADPLVKAFNDSHADIKVEVVYVDRTKLAQVVGTQIQGGNPPDLVSASPGTGDNALSVHVLGAAGKLVDLSDQPFAKSVPALLRPLVTVNGKVYSLILGLTTNYFGYTVPVFEQYKIAPPATWAEVLQACKTFRSHGAYAMSDGLAATSSNLLKIGSFAAANVYSENPDWDQDRAAGKVTFAGTPGWHAVFQQVVDMIKADCFYPGYAGRKFEGALQLLAQDKAHMGIHPSFSWAALHKASPKRIIGTAIVPGARAAALPIGIGAALSVASESKSVAQAIEFLNYASRHLKDFSENTGAVSPLDLAAGRLPAFLAPLEPVARQGRFRLAAGVMWPSAAIVQAGEHGITGLATGQTTIAEILARMDEAWDRSTRSESRR